MRPAERDNDPYRGRHVRVSNISLTHSFENDPARSVLSPALISRSEMLRLAPLHRNLGVVHNFGALKRD